MKHAEFVHLHLHTQYSLLDGTIRLDDLFKRLKEYAMPAVAMTDHGNVYGAIHFYQQAFKNGIKPIIGCELYVAPRSRFDRQPGNAGEGNNRHLVVLVKNLQGWKNLMKLTTAAFREGFYYRPRVDVDLLRAHNAGLIGMSACMHGVVADHILRDDMEAARAAAREYKDIFGPDRFYLEIMENGLPEQKKVNEALMEIGRDLGIPLVATNDCHYLKQSDADAHEVLLCIQTGRTIDDPQRMRFATDAFYVRSPEEMKRLFAYCPEAVENTVKIAERCNLTFEFGKFHLPTFALDSGVTLDEQLARVAREGLETLLPELLAANPKGTREIYEKRLAEELKMISSMGFAGYFLIVSDFITYAKKRGIPVGPGRGSAAGSLVAMTTGITSIDPIRYRLFFERFLNPDRISMPDIDTDFCQEGRDEVIRYVTEKYGSDHVAQIITFGAMKAKAVIRDVGRALGIPYAEVDVIAKLVPNALDITLPKAIELEPRLREEAKKNDRIQKLLDLSLALEGLNRHSSTHAAGVVISDIPLVERVPLCKSPTDDIVTQFSMKDLETAGLTKFDFLGLKTLTVMRDALRMVKEGKGCEVDLEKLPLNDETTYALLQRGETDGVFQLESDGMKGILVSMKPDCIEDLIALIALYRPGPMKNIPVYVDRKQGRAKVDYSVPELEDILRETYGIIIYQEQVMQIASAIGGYTMAQADNLRRTMSKKKKEEMDKERPKFLAGAKARSVPEAKAVAIWQDMETFAEYGFNKSHSTAYAVISYQTAYLKAHYPSEFMAALLTSEKDNRDKIIRHINVCKDMGLSVLPPDINESKSDFSVSEERIRFGLAAVKNVGEGAVESILNVRDASGPFRSFADFLGRVDLRKVNKRVLESLIKCGAFDSLGDTRHALTAGYEACLDALARRQRAKDSAQVSFFDAMDAAETDGAGGADAEYVIPPLPEWDHKELLACEKETLGFYITGHPLERFKRQMKYVATGTSASIADGRDKDTVVLAGIVSECRETMTKKKEIMAYVTLEDLAGSSSLIFFPERYRAAYDLLHKEDPIVVTGKLDVGEEKVKIIAGEVEALTAALEKCSTASVHFTIPVRDNVNDIIYYIKTLSNSFKGGDEAFIHLLNGKTETVISLGPNKFRASDTLSDEVRKLMGSACTVAFHEPSR